MSIISLLRFYWLQPRVAFARWKLSREMPSRGLTGDDWKDSLQAPTEFYLDCVRYFDTKLPEPFKKHRYYFNNTPKRRRGFGEDAFHVMWYLILQKLRPERFLEIGVYRGQVISLVSLWSYLNSNNCEVFGISPFSSAGDSVSRYAQSINYYEDTLANFRHFGLKYPHLLRAYSTDPSAQELIKNKVWDLVYIDGNHEYAVARQDFEISAKHLRMGGVIVLDDSALTTNFRPPPFASRGHPGPSRLAQEITSEGFEEILQVGHNRVFRLVKHL